MGFRHQDLTASLEVLPVPAYVILADGDRKIFAANRRCCDLLGYTERELLNLPWPRIIGEVDVARAEVAIVSSAPQNLEVWHLRRKDATSVEVKVKYSNMLAVTDDDSVRDAFFVLIMEVLGKEAARIPVRARAGAERA